MLLLPFYSQCAVVINGLISEKTASDEDLAGFLIKEACSDAARGDPLISSHELATVGYCERAYIISILPLTLLVLNSTFTLRPP